MYIYRLVAVIAASIALLSGCSTQQTQPSTMENVTLSATPDLECTPLLDTNWIGQKPKWVEDIGKKPWVVTKVQHQWLTVTYFRDCGVEFRGPRPDDKQYGYLFESLFCLGTTRTTTFNPDPRSIGGNPIDILGFLEMKELKKQLVSARDCAVGKVTPI